MRIKNAFTVFVTPAWLLASCISLGVLGLEIVRVPLGAGYLINVMILYLTLALFVYSSAKLRHAITAGVSPRLHSLGGVLFGIAWSTLVALANTVSATLAYWRDYYYESTDAFFIQVPGVRQLIDTNGEPYSVWNGGITAESFAINWAIHFACLAAMCALGALLGTIRARWSILAVAGFVVAGLFAAYFFIVWQEANGIRLEAPLPGVFVYMIPITVLSAMVALFLSQTMLPRSRYALASR